MIIYKIVNDVNDKVYIGQTTKSLDRRIEGHKNSMISGVDTHLYRAMRKYGWDKFHFEVIATAPDQDSLNDMEAYFINKYDSIANGYNMAPGGSVNTMYSSVVAKKHASKMRSVEVRNKISVSMKQSYKDRGGPSESHKAHLSESRKALYASAKGEIVKERFRSSFKLSPAHYKALNDAKNKSVYCIDESGNLVKEFERVKDAADWWWHNGYSSVKDPDQLSTKIKESFKYDKYVKGLKWIYRV